MVSARPDADRRLSPRRIFAITAASLVLCTGCGSEGSDEASVTCVDAVPGASWWSLTEDLGADPNTYWAEVRDANPSAQGAEDPNVVIAGRTVCLPIDTGAATLPAPAGPDADADSGSDQVTNDDSAATDASTMDAGGGPPPDTASEVTPPTPQSCGNPFFCVRYSPPDPYSIVTGDNEGAIPATVDPIVELYLGEKWAEIAVQYQELGSDRAVTEVTRAAIFAIADLNVHGEPAAEVLTYYESELLPTLVAAQGEAAYQSRIEEILDRLRRESTGG